MTLYALLLEVPQHGRICFSSEVTFNHVSVCVNGTAIEILENYYGKHWV